MNIRETINALANMSLSSRELLAMTFDARDRQESNVRSFISWAEDAELLQRAKEIDAARAKGRERRPLAGIPIAVKDNIAVRGMTLTCGSKMLKEYVPPYSATAVERLDEAGLLVVGKTNMDEFGFGSSTENSAFFPTANPNNLSRVPGGTSGGSAAAVAARIVPWALGTDTGGSVRQPSSLCGVVGIRPTYGRVSRYGLVAYSSSMDQIGPIAPSVDDAAILLTIIAGPDVRDSTNLGPAANVSYGLDRPDDRFESLRCGIPREYLSESCDPQVLQAVELAKRAALSLGWTVELVSLPMTKYAISIYYLIASVEAASNLARYDGVKYGYRSPEGATYEKMLINTRTEGFGDEAKRRILLGTYASSAGYHDQYYEQALRGRRMFSDELNRAFRTIDILIAPVSPTAAWELGKKVADPMQMYLSDVFTISAPLAGIPSLALPVMRDADNLPVGVQLCAARMMDETLIGAAARLEKVMPDLISSANNHDF